MQYSITLSALLASLAAVNAQTPGFNPFITPKPDQDVRAGSNFDISWEPAGAPDDATVSIKLLQGTSPQTLQTGPVVASNIPSKMGHFNWAVPRSIKDSEVYGLAMYLDGKEEVFQYSPPFDIDNLDNDDDDRPPPANGKPLKFPPPPGSKFDDDDDDDDYRNGPPRIMGPVAGPDDKGPADKGAADKGPADKGPADKGPADKGPADKVPADKGPAKDKPKSPPNEAVPDLKYNNGTVKASPPSPVKPKPSAAILAPSSPSNQPGKPKPVTVINGASPVVLNWLSLLGGMAVFLAL